MNKKNVGRLLIIIGAMLLAAALSLNYYNWFHAKQSVSNMDSALAVLKEAIGDESEITSSAIDDNDNGSESQVVDDNGVELDGKIYIGTISLPSLGQEFPVIKNWSYPDMNVAPCRYDGSRSGRDLIICAHNYKGFFDKLDKLNAGDEVIFTDIYGRKFNYEVSYSELIGGWDTASMYRGAAEDWDLTLFSFTWSGYSRVTVRCVRA